jgi:histone acetyltransferase
MVTGQSRDDYAKSEEDKGLISFPVVYNDGAPEHMVALIGLKNIFSAQLPKMPKEYIVRLVLDRNHRSLCIMKKGRVIGGVCFRPFLSQAFAEIVFWSVHAASLLTLIKPQCPASGCGYATICVSA